MYFFCAVTEDKHIEKQCKESDKSSSISELKLDMRTGSSASNINCESEYGGGRDSDSITTRVAVPLAEPVPVDQQYAIPMNRYSSGDFRDPMFLPKVSAREFDTVIMYIRVQGVGVC